MSGAVWASIPLQRVSDLTSVVFIITDHDETIRSTVTGAHLIWDGQTYSLWKLDGGNWAVTADGGVHNDAVHLSGLAEALQSTASGFVFAPDPSSQK